MKQIIIIFILLFGCVEITAKDFLHLPLIGNVSKQQVGCLHFNHDESSPIWDLSKLQTRNDNYLLSYEQNPLDENMLIGTEHNTRYFYQCCSDTLFLWGYENCTSRIEYDIPELIYKEDLGLCNHVYGVFHGLEFYGGRLSFRLFGIYRFEAISKGTMVLPSGDSLRHVTMVHYAKNICKEKLSKVKSSDKLRSIVFSSHPYDADSVIAKMKNDANQIIVHQYKWYAEGYRYPIYETITTGTSSTPNLYELAFYSSPEEQAKEYDVANEKVRAIMTKNQGYADNAEGSHDDNHGDGNSVTIGISGKMSANGSLAVCLDVTKTGYADIMVYTADGLLVSSQTNVFLSQGRKSYSYDVSNYKSDVYIVTCIVDGTKTSTKITGNSNKR